MKKLRLYGWSGFAVDRATKSPDPDTGKVLMPPIAGVILSRSYRRAIDYAHKQVEEAWPEYKVQTRAWIWEIPFNEPLPTVWANLPKAQAIHLGGVLDLQPPIDNPD